MNDIQPKKLVVTETSRDKFLEIYKEAGEALKSTSEFPMLETETTSSYTALIDYYLMGHGRSAAALLRYYQTQDSPPTRSAATLKGWSHRYSWTERIEQYEKTVIDKQLGVLEIARLQFIGKQVGVLFLLEEAVVKAAAHVDMEDVNLGQFARAVEKFATVTQKVFDMQPTIRVSHSDDSQPFKGLSAKEGMNELSELVKIMKERNALEEVIDGEYTTAETVSVEDA